MTYARWATRLLCCVAALACGLGGCGPKETYPVRFDGLYVSDARTTGNAAYRHYLRFYEQGAVYGASSTVAPDEVAVWLRAPFENHGTWRIEDDVLHCSCTSPRGTVDYEGEVLRDGLRIRFASRINEKRGERSYDFFEVAPDDAGP